MLRSIIIALQTYSRIPMPQVEWTEKSMKYAICFFPVVGIFTGGFEILWVFLAGLLHLPALIYGAVACAIPILVSGAIHMDGFCDTVDALSSHQSKERMLEILKDSHAGAFAIIFGALYLIVYFASWSGIATIIEWHGGSWNILFAVCFGFILSRGLSGLALNLFRGARSRGMLQGFKDAADKKMLTITMLIYIIVAAFFMIFFAGWIGAVMVAANGLLFLYYRLLSYRKFGGITGDLAGWFLQLSELTTIVAAVLLGFVL